MKFKNVAVCLSGHMRTFRETVAPLKELFLDQICENYDFFIYTAPVLDRKKWRWGLSSSHMCCNLCGQSYSEDGKPKNKGYELPDHKCGPLSKQDISDIFNLYDPKKFVVDKKNDYIGADREPMLRRMKLADSLREEYERENNIKYDLVIRMRPDQLIVEKFDSTFLLDPKKMGIVGFGKVWGGYQDTFAISSPENMSLYSDLINHVSRLKETSSARIEVVLKRYLEENNIEIYEIPLRFFIRRSWGENHAAHDQDPITGHPLPWRVHPDPRGRW